MWSSLLVVIVAENTPFSAAIVHIFNWCTKCGTVWTIVVLGTLYSEAHVKFHIRYVVDTSVNCSISEICSKLKLEINGEMIDNSFCFKVRSMRVNSIQGINKELYSSL